MPRVNAFKHTIPWSFVRVLAIVTLLLASGCAQPPADAEDDVPAESFDEFQLEDTPVELGVIRGVVLDPALNPLPGVLVTLLQDGRNVTSKDDGAFAFKDVEAGTHFLKATLPRFTEIQTSTIVVAGETEPPVLRILMERIPGTEPRIEYDIFQGVITCSIRIPAAGFNDGCVAFGDLGLGTTQRTDLAYEGPIHWWQAEVIWVSNGPTTERLCTSVNGVDDGAQGDSCNVRPIVRYMDADRVKRNNVDDGEEFEIVVYPDHLVAGASGNLVIDQSFEVVFNVFYNFSPIEGWTFDGDGEHPVPA